MGLVKYVFGGASALWGAGMFASEDVRTTTQQTIKLLRNPDNVVNAFASGTEGYVDYFGGRFEEKFLTYQNPAEYTLVGEDRELPRRIIGGCLPTIGMLGVIWPEYTSYISNSAKRLPLKLAFPVMMVPLLSTVISRGLIDQVRPQMDFEGRSSAASLAGAMTFTGWKWKFFQSDLLYSFLNCWALTAPLYTGATSLRTALIDPWLIRFQGHRISPEQRILPQDGTWLERLAVIRKKILGIKPKNRYLAGEIIGKNRFEKFLLFFPKFFGKIAGTRPRIQYTLTSWAIGGFFSGIIAVLWKFVQGYGDRPDILKTAGVRPWMLRIPNDMLNTAIESSENYLKTTRFRPFMDTQLLFFIPSILTMDLLVDPLNENRATYETLNESTNRRILYSGGDPQIIGAQMALKREIQPKANETEQKNIVEQDKLLRRIPWLKSA